MPSVISAVALKPIWCIDLSHLGTPCIKESPTYGTKRGTPLSRSLNLPTGVDQIAFEIAHPYQHHTRTPSSQKVYRSRLTSPEELPSRQRCTKGLVGLLFPGSSKHLRGCATCELSSQVLEASLTEFRGTNRTATLPEVSKPNSHVSPKHFDIAQLSHFYCFEAV